MDQQQRDLRRAAAQAFMQSLEQLQETLQPDDDPSADDPSADDQMTQSTVPPVVQPAAQPTGMDPDEPMETSALDFDLSSLEQAVADIEEFIQAKRQQREQ